MKTTPAAKILIHEEHAGARSFLFSLRVPSWIPHGCGGKPRYGSGMRLNECLRLRVKDVDFAGHQITVRDGKGFKDRVTMLPRSLVGPLKRQLE